MRRLSPFLVTLLPALLLSAACSSDPAAPSDGDTAGSSGSATAGGAGGAGGSGNEPKRCPPGDNEPSAANLVEVGRITGQIVDEEGAPTSAGLVQICGKDVCTQADVGSSGRLSEDVGDVRDTPAVKYGDGFEWAKLTRLVQDGDNDVGSLVTVRLPPFEDAPALTPGEAVSSGGVTLTLDASARVEVNFLDYETEAQQGFRAAALPAAALEQLPLPFVQAYALSPLETHVCPSPALTLENSSGLEPGTELELYLLGLDVEEEFAPYATWSRVGEGSVSADGKSLEFPGGVPVLTAIGVKVKE
jgi:hypothetical protein